jgi:hypothetical protein
MKLSRRAWMLITALIAVAGITLSSLVGASGEVNGSGSSLFSKLSFSVGATAAIAFIVLCVLAVLAARSSRRAVNATTSRARS